MKRRAALLALALHAGAGGVGTRGVAPDSTAVNAASSKTVSLALTQDLVQRSDTGGAAEIIIESPRTVLPGDVLREQVTVRNLTRRRVGPLNVTVPVPAGAVFRALGTPAASRWTVLYSVDGGKTFSARPSRTVTVTENGQSVTRQVPLPPTSYTTVRWRLSGLEPDETLKFNFRVQIR